MLECKCMVNTKDDNVLVGVECRTNDNERDVYIHFPLGYRLSPPEDEHGQRRDILLLLSVLRHYSQKLDGILTNGTDTGDVKFPVEAYLYIIRDYTIRGYYREKDVTYKVSKRGKINWNRTIKTQKSYVQGTSIFYLDFVTRNQEVKDNEWITLIHKYCVYISFLRMGWLFTGYIPEKPPVKRNDKLFKAVLRDKINQTFDDNNKHLFNSMMAVLGYEEVCEATKAFRYGTTSFYHVWEAMIDYVYGADNKQDYFPRTIWRVRDKKTGKIKQIYKSPLEPDSIMPYGGNLFILDAKYYKYGVTTDVGDLPDTSSIHKQITYGEYIANRSNLWISKNMNIYNVFILPFATSHENGLEYVGELDYIGEAVSEWKENSKTYEHVEGILLDTKMLMEMNVRKDIVQIKKLAEFIESYYREARVLEAENALLNTT